MKNCDENIKIFNPKISPDRKTDRPEHDDEGVRGGECEEDERKHRRRAAVEDGRPDRHEGGGRTLAAALSCQVEFASR